jgi:sn-glycerol 3-phosphate transport system substrate-binding protein
MSAKAPTPNSKGLRFGNFAQVRDIIYGELESIFAGKKTAKQGLDYAVQQGNALLRKFEKTQ